MFCQNCGSVVPDNAKFCGKCGSGVTASAETAIPAQAENNAAQAVARQPQSPGTYQAYNAQASAQSYVPPPVNTAQQAYIPPQTVAAQPYYGAPQTPKSGAKSVPGMVLLLAGGALLLIGYFLPMVVSGSVGISLADFSFGMGLLAGGFSLTLVPLTLFLVCGLLALLFGAVQPKLGWIASIVGIAATIYVFFGTTPGGISISSTFDLLQYAGIGLWLSAAGIVASITGSIVAMATKK